MDLLVFFIQTVIRDIRNYSIYTTRKKDEDNWSIDFNPAYTKDAELIFIKTYKECPFCIALIGIKENRKEYVTLSFIKYW